MVDDIYMQLARFLDDLPAGFPRSESGVELRILRHLFTPEEAHLAMQLALISEEAPVIAVRAGLPLLEAGRILDQLERKHLIYAFRDPGKPARYMAEQFAIGFWEGQVNRLDRELVEMFEEYLPTYSRSGNWQKTPQLRTIPVRKSVPVGEDIPITHTVLSYENVETIVASHHKFAVANCVCRQEMDLLGHACDKPRETCLAFDGNADYFVQDGRGRYITREETLEIIRRGEESGLVLQPGNDRTASNLCMCCGCCCGVLRSAKLNAHPAAVLASAFYAVVDQDACAGCGTCLERCQMGAIDLPEGLAVIDLQRCIGCGLCVTTCAMQAITLVRKPAPQQPGVPKDVVQMTIRLAQARGRLTPWHMARLGARSVFDRLRAALKAEK